MAIEYGLDRGAHSSDSSGGRGVEMRKALQQICGAKSEVSLVYRLDEAHQRTGKKAPRADLGLLFADHVPIDRYEDLRLELTELIGVDLNTPYINVLILNGASANLAYSAIAQGELLYTSSDRERKSWEGRIRSEFLRTIYSRSVSARDART